MASKSVLRRRLAFRESALEKLYAAYEALIAGGVKQYMIDDRQLTKFDIPVLKNEIEELEREIDALENAISGTTSGRKAVGVIPRDW